MFTQIMKRIACIIVFLSRDYCVATAWLLRGYCVATAWLTHTLRVYNMASEFRSEFAKTRSKNEANGSEKLRVLTLNCW
jgi:hypothetical protein